MLHWIDDNVRNTTEIRKTIKLNSLVLVNNYVEKCHVLSFASMDHVPARTKISLLDYLITLFIKYLSNPCRSQVSLSECKRIRRKEIVTLQEFLLRIYKNKKLIKKRTS